jgi:NifB/MoaA-like Fe-S oxidoreductase
VVEVKEQQPICQQNDNQHDVRYLNELRGVADSLLNHFHIGVVRLNRKINGEDDAEESIGQLQNIVESFHCEIFLDVRGE